MKNFKLFTGTQILLTLIAGILISCGGDDPIDDGAFLDNDGEVINDDESGWSVPVANVLAGQIKDGIPSVDNPRFVSLADVTTIPDEELVIGYKKGDDVRAYPHQILDWHEIVNDDIGGDKLALTYCPLTGTAIGWNRELNGQETTFGVSGLLFNTNLMPYDRQTSSVWSQMLTAGVNGDLRDNQAEILQVIEMPWKDWKEIYPNSSVLSRDTGFERTYGRYPYGSYRQTNSLLFPVITRDDRLFGKERVLGVIINDLAKVYRFTIMEQDGSLKVIKDTFQDQELLVVGNNRFMNVFQIGGVSSAQDFTSVMDREFIAVQGQLPIAFEDNTGNKYDVFGVVVEGPESGDRLGILEAYMGFFFSFGTFYPNPEILE